MMAGHLCGHGVCLLEAAAMRRNVQCRGLVRNGSNETQALLGRLAQPVTPCGGIAAVRRPEKAQRAVLFGTVVVVVAVQGAYRLGDVVARIGNGQLAAVAASREIASNIAAGSGRGLPKTTS
jgi:hypothetical protein